MIVEKEKIIEAKNIMGEKAAINIAKDLNIERWDERSLKGSCPMGHDDNTPSFIWNNKNNSFHCFSCGTNYGILDHYIKYNNLTFLKAVERLFQETGIKYSFGEIGVRKERDYNYPKYKHSDSMDLVEKYCATRGLSKEVLGYCGVSQSSDGLMMFNFYDENDVLLTVKCRNTHKTKDGAKEWYLPNYDNSPILFNMNKIDPTQPLLITEGMMDTLACIDAGYTNTVSIPGGTNDLKFIEKCYDWLENFSQIILWFDNDEPGIKARKEVASRLGQWRILTVELPKEITKEDGTKQKVKDANEVLYYLGKQQLLNFINTAQEVPISGIQDLSSVDDFDIEKSPGLYSGIKPIDNILYKFLFGSVVMFTGTRGCVDCDTEFFNGKTWKKISEYVVGDSVLQYNPDRTASLVTPTAYHKYPQEYLWHFSTKYGIDQCLSDNHNVVYETSKNNLYKKDFLSFKNSYVENNYNPKFLASFKYEGEGIEYSDDVIRLLIAASADGSYYYNLKETSNAYNKCRFHLKKEHKKSRLIEIIEKTGFEYSVNQSSKESYTDIYVNLPFRMKEFEDWWYNCNNHQLNVIAEEVMHWDGNIKKMSYCTTIKKNADFIQFVFSSIGHIANISINDRRGRIRNINGKDYITKSIDYEVIVSDIRKSLRLRGDISKEDRESIFKKYKTVDGFEYCFSVPSEMLVLRRNNRIFITGNSGKSSMINQIFVCEALNQGHDVFMFSGELSAPVLKSWIELTMAGKEKVQMKDKFNRAIDFTAREQMRAWYKSRIWIYDDMDNSSDAILNKAVTTTRKYGTKVWILDNLMTIDLKNGESNVLQKQKEFLSKLIQLAKLYNVLIVLVAHPRKLQNGVELSGDDVSGSGDMANLAQYLLSVKRFSKKDKEGERDNKGNYRKGKEPIDEDVSITILKNRYTGFTDEARLYFDYSSYRFFSNGDELYKRYGWNKDASPLPKLNIANQNVPDFMRRDNE